MLSIVYLGRYLKRRGFWKSDEIEPKFVEKP